MQNNKPEIVFTFPAALGGVSSFNFNIINNSFLLKNFHSKVILMKPKNESRPLFQEKFLVDEQVVFEYDDNENQFHLQKRLNDLLGNIEGAIVTDNGMTVETARRFNNPKTVFSLLHDYYYVNQQVKLFDWSDIVIAHSSFFSDAVFASDPEMYANRALYIPYGVKQLKELPEKNNEILNLVFLGRLEEGKGVLRLIDIQNKLQEKNIEVSWTIIGKGSAKEILHEQWKNERVVFYEPDTTEEVYEALKTQDVFVFPTIFEGTPVAILEALACGVVTIVNDLPGGIRDVLSNEVGFRCQINNLNEFADKIILLNSNRNLLAEMQKKCFALANKNYDVKQNSDNYISSFLKYEKYKRKSKMEARRLLKLDNVIFPNWLTIAIRNIK